MISANELRLGNLLQDEFGRVGPVLQFTESMVKIKMEFSTFKSETDKGVKGLDVDPVPLTEDWLLRFGFAWQDDRRSHIIKFYNRLHVSIYFNDGSIELFQILNEEEPSEINYFAMKAPKFVHQLQNLYFSLTNTELQLTPLPADKTTEI